LFNKIVVKPEFIQYFRLFFLRFVSVCTWRKAAWELQMRRSWPYRVPRGCLHLHSLRSMNFVPMVLKVPLGVRR